ncbi:AlpA family phage regulatory protein [Bradyrhizobium sp. B117]|uniref:helix-turn-helix transcriptional regulator n=1 Tax=Bradyrhizobium sp. B117 TaxID=3140246 RepID=UPI0031837EAF
MPSLKMVKRSNTCVSRAGTARGHSCLFAIETPPLEVVLTAKGVGRLSARRVAWIESEIDDWIAARIAARRQPIAA